MTPFATRTRRVCCRRTRAAGGRRGRAGASDQVARGERLRDSRAAGDGALRWRDRRLSLERRARRPTKPAAGRVAASVRGLGDVLGELVELDVEAIGVDLYATDFEALPRLFPKTLLAGVVDARNSLVEEPGDLAGVWPPAAGRAGGRSALRAQRGSAVCTGEDS